MRFASSVTSVLLSIRFEDGGSLWWRCWRCAQEVTTSDVVFLSERERERERERVQVASPKKAPDSPNKH